METVDIARIREALQSACIPPWEPPPQGITDEVIDGFVQRTGLTLPTDFREWLGLVNGLNCTPGGLFGIRPDSDYVDIESHFKYLPVWLHNGWIPVAGDGCGDYYVLACRHDFGKGFPVLFFDQCDFERPAYLVASDIWHFVVRLLEGERGEESGWPFNEAFMLREDPDLARFDNSLLPWKTT